ncbi:LysR family transcriptional regulator [Fodinicola acaciae]|uniref:LysR family transcriptional regulator n=1 Tax=Fodinicola acaciae TaxID=2681555 RepID=UPI0013D2CB94|nr:LysR family transcriptional regulator [Fodinicola acaciae]
MDTRHLELLRELAERGSVTAVAQATFRTPSAVSQQLKAAQREFGMRLVEPSGRGLRLTEAGRLLADGGASVAAAIERVQAEWDAFRGGPAGTVTIAALPSAATFLFAGAIRELAGSAITLRFSDFDIAEAEFAGLAADSDIVIAHSLAGPRPAGTERLTVVSLAREPLDVAMAADHPLTVRPALTAADVVDAEWIGVPEGFPFDSVLRAIEQATSAELRIAQRLRDNRLIESLVASGRQLAILPRFTTPTDCGLVLRPLTDIPSTRHVSAIMRPDKAERLSVQRVLGALLAVAADVQTRHTG